MPVFGNAGAFIMLAKALRWVSVSLGDDQVTYHPVGHQRAETQNPIPDDLIANSADLRCSRAALHCHRLPQEPGALGMRIIFRLCR